MRDISGFSSGSARFYSTVGPAPFYRGAVNARARQIATAADNAAGAVKKNSPQSTVNAM
jgi:hypothetical protein